MYQVLYRKWRPQRFSDVYGQNLITATLKNELRTGRIAHAYLFTGSRGTGKTSCAKILAKAVNCLDLQDGDPCNQCTNCRGIDDGVILDIVEMDAASNRGIDNMRDLREEVNFTPSVVRYRVYIIDEVHMLTSEAFNALLKTLEEPPAHVIFVLATTEVHKLPSTIKSRCQRFDFQRILPEDIAERIQFIAQHEDFSVTDDAALLIAKLADGGMRDALSMLDQCITQTKSVTVDTVSDTAGLAGHDHLFDFSKAIKTGDAGNAIALVGKLYNASRDMERLCSELIDFYRSLMIVKSVPKPDRLIVASPSELESLQKHADEYELTEIMYCMDTLQRTFESIKAGASRRVAMEMAMLRLCSPELSDDKSSLLRRVQAIESALKAGARVPAAQSAQQLQTVQKTDKKTDKGLIEHKPKQQLNPATVPTDNTDKGSDTGKDEGIAKETEFSGWDQVVEILYTTCPPLHGVLQDSTACIRGDFILIETDNEMFKSLVTRNGNKRILADAIKSVTGRSYRIGIKKKSAAKQEFADPLSAFIRDSRNMGINLEVE